MDAQTFDAMVRRLGSGLSRRQALQRLVAGAAAVAASATALETVSAARNGRNRCKKAGRPCTSSKQCCPRETKRRCKVQRNAGNSDTTCCGTTGAKCGGKNSNGDDIRPFCCTGYDCFGRTCRRGNAPQP